jgi:hypothetical protein
MPAACSRSSASSRSISRLRSAAVSSLATATCSISSCLIRRSTSSISVGTEDSSIETRDAASTIRSIA